MDSDNDFSPPSRTASGHFSIGPVSIIVACALALTILGIIILFSATTTIAKTPTFYLVKQLIGVGAAFVAGFIFSRIDLEWWRRYAWVIGGIAAVLLVAVLIPGIGHSVNGSRRWLRILGQSVQASEIGKIALVYCLAHYLAINQTRILEFKRGFLIPLGITLFAGALIAKEPDLGTASLTIAIGLILIFFAGARMLYIVPSIAGVIAALSVVVWLIPNRLARFTAFLDVEANKQGLTYQLYQSLAAFAAGGINGAGLGQGRQQLAFLPEAQTDFIGAVIGEELGLVGTMLVVVLFLTMFIAGLVHLRRAPNMFQFLLAAGCLFLISLQAIINLGVVTGIFPTKGMSLPFISAGLSNLLLMGVLLGLLMNTQRNWPRPAFSRNERLMKEVVQM